VNDAERRQWHVVTTGIEPHTMAYVFETSASMERYQVANVLRVRLSKIITTCQWTK
jgi:hypothetical protein